MAKNSHFSTFFDFLKNCPCDSNEISHSHSTPLENPICAMASKSFTWDVRNLAKISPKKAKKRTFFISFRFSQNCPYDSNEIVYSHSTPYYGPLCAISLSSYGWVVRNIVKINPKMAKNSRLSTFFDFRKNCPYDSNEILYSPSTVYYGPSCVISSNSYC